MCYMPWHLPWKLNLLNCCLESHTSINWRGSVDIWLSDISRRDGLPQPRHHICGLSTIGLLNTAKIIIVISLMQAPIKHTVIIEIAATRRTNLSLDTWDRCHRMTSNLLISHFRGSDFTCVSAYRGLSYLLLFSANQISPFLCYVAEVHLVHGHLDVANGIVFGEAVKIVNCHYQCLSTELHVGDLRRMTTETGQKGLNTVILSQ